jgi:hypothetical protein
MATQPAKPSTTPKQGTTNPAGSKPSNGNKPVQSPSKK